MTEKQIIRTFEQVLPVDLSHSQVEEKGIELANLEAEIAAYLEEAKAERASQRVKRNDLEARRAALAEVVRTGKEERPVPCVLRASTLPDHVDVVRMDTRVVLTTRRLKDDESQGEMPFEIPEEDELAS